MNQNKLKLMEIVGSGGVQDHPDLGESFSLDNKLNAHLFPYLLVRPGNADEVQKIVLWANETKTALVPTSSGGRIFMGIRFPLHLTQSWWT